MKSDAITNVPLNRGIKHRIIGLNRNGRYGIKPHEAFAACLSLKTYRVSRGRNLLHQDPLDLVANTGKQNNHGRYSTDRLVLVFHGVINMEGAFRYYPTGEDRDRQQPGNESMECDVTVPFEAAQHELHHYPDRQGSYAGCGQGDEKRLVP